MKTKLIIFLVLFVPSICSAEDVATYTGATYTGCRSIGNTNVFLDNPNDYATIKSGFVYLPNGCGSLPQVAAKHLKQVGGAIVEMTQAEKDAVDSAEIAAAAAALLSSSRSGAKDSVDQLSAEGVRLRAALLIILDEMNILRTRDRDRSADVAAATNLADLKTRWAARAALDDRTAAQIKTSLKARIDAGDADS